MPDLITHLIAGYIVSDLKGYDKAVFLLGSVLPDAKIVSYLLAPFLTDQTTQAIFCIFDAPVVFIPLALLFSAFFRGRRTVFVCLSYAVLLHLGLDFLQYKFGGGVLLFYPPIAERYSLGLFWQDNYYLTIAVVTAFIGLLIYRRVMRGKPKT